MKNRIDVENISNKNEAPPAGLEKMVNWILQQNHQEHSWTITIVFVDDSFIIEQNQKYFNKSTPTDVISFNLSDSEDEPEGEIYISVDTAKRNADYYQVTLDNEMLRLVAHGVYHLLNHNDTTPEEKDNMSRLENKALEYIYSTF